jgi:hypothetical protein
MYSKHWSLRMAPDLVSLPVIFRLKLNRRVFVDVLVDGLTYIAMHQRDHTSSLILRIYELPVAPVILAVLG